MTKFNLTSEGYPIKIPFSKIKIILLLFGAIAFVALSIWIFNDLSTKQMSDFKRTNMILISILGAVFFSICAIFAFTKLFESNPALIIDEFGIIDNSSLATLGQKILWKDISNISSYSIHNQNIIKIVLKNPNDYIENTKWKHKRFLLNMNLKFNGTPVNISANSVQMNFKELKELLIEQKKQHN